MKKSLLMFALSFICLLGLTTNSFALAPTPIRDLRCFAGGELGSIWLSWTVPTGTTNYEVRYVQGNTISWGTAITHPQSWVPGSAGEVRQEIVRGLSPGVEFAFGMTAIAGESASPISNQVLCTPATAIRAERDALSPSTTISFPSTNASIRAGDLVTIRGSSRDRGSSSVQKVEISFDGRNWANVTPVSNIDGNLAWEYVWRNPITDITKISVRAYDWVGNIETPVETPVAVISATAGDALTITPPVLPILPTTPVLPTPPNVATLQAEMRSLQAQIIALLTELIARLQAQLNALR